MKFRNFLIFIIILLSTQSLSFADIPHFLDFKYILNSSDAGKKAQVHLKKKLENGIKNISNKEKSILEEEKKIINQKKIISAEAYKQKVIVLRKKVSSIQKERNDLLDNVAKQRSKARNELLKNLNPIVKKYMNEKNIRMVVDKKSLLLADEDLDITNDIISILNKQLTSIKLN
jgi:outer membrane protein